MASVLMVFSASPYWILFLLILLLVGRWLGGKCGKHRESILWPILTSSYVVLSSLLLLGISAIVWKWGCYSFVFLVPLLLAALWSADWWVEKLSSPIRRSS